MKESYRRRNSGPSWPRPCEGGATQRPHLKRWTGAHVGWVSLKLMSSEIIKTRGADGVRLTGRQHCDVRYLACASRALRSRRPQACMETGRPLGTREPRDPVAIRSPYGADRWEKAMSYKTHVYGDRESHNG